MEQQHYSWHFFQNHSIFKLDYPKPTALQLQSFVSLSPDLLLTPGLLGLLSHPPSFIPTPTRPPHCNLFRWVLDFVRKLQWSLSLPARRLANSNHRFGLSRSGAWPPQNLLSPSLRRLSKRILCRASSILQTCSVCYGQPNLSPDEIAALQTLVADPDVLIRPADKGQKWTLMSHSAYTEECRRLLSDSSSYSRLSSSLTASNVASVTQILSGLLSQRFISPSEFTFLLPSPQPRPRQFSILPKLHKPSWPSSHMPPGRPLVADVDTDSSAVDRLIEFFLQPLARAQPSFIRDSLHFIALVSSDTFPPGSFLCTADISALYTSIPIPEALSRISTAFSQNPDPSRPDDHLLCLLRLCLHNNDFVFLGEHWLQTKGVAMGKCFGGSLSNIYLGTWEATALASFPLNPLKWLRFQDDIFFVWPHSQHDLTRFIEHLNLQDPNIQVTATFSNSSVRFLDLELSFSPDLNILYQVGFKETDLNFCLPSTSHHPHHTSRSVIYSQILRWATRSSTREFFRATCRRVFKVWRRQGISGSRLRSSVTRVLNVTNQASVWEKGFYPCNGARCRACRFARPLTSFSDSSGQNLFPIVHRLDCSTPDCCYVVFCTRCNLQYVGQTSQPLRQRIGEHIRSVALPSPPTHLARHFSSGSCSLDNLQFFALEHSPTSSTRLAKESLWIRRLRTVSPRGFNVSEGSVPQRIHLITRRSICASRLNDSIRHLLRPFDVNIPVRLAYTVDKNLRSILK